MHDWPGRPIIGAVKAAGVSCLRAIRELDTDSEHLRWDARGARPAVKVMRRVEQQAGRARDPRRRTSNSKPIGQAPSPVTQTATFSVRASTRSSGTTAGSVPRGGPNHSGIR
jgi:hypothetical protein